MNLRHINFHLWIKGDQTFGGFQFFIEAAIFIITHQRMEKMVRAHEAVAKRLLQSVNY